MKEEILLDIPHESVLAKYIYFASQSDISSKFHISSALSLIFSKSDPAFNSSHSPENSFANGSVEWRKGGSQYLFQSDNI